MRKNFRSIYLTDHHSDDANSINIIQKETENKMKKAACFLIMVSYLIGPGTAATWNFNGNSNDNSGNPSIDSNIYFQNGSAILNGNSIIKIPDREEFSFSKGITLAGRIRPTITTHSYIVFKGNENAGSDVFLLQLTDENHFQAGLFDKVNGTTEWKPLVEYGEEVVPDRWYTVVFTYDNSVAKLYVNNRLVSTENFGKPILQDSHDISIGNREGLDRGFSGQIDEVEIIDHALTEEEVAKRYILQSSEVAGNSVCEGYENKDNAPEDCGKRNGSRNIGDIYHSKNESIELWKELVAAHPDVSSYEVVGKSIQGRNIYLFKFGNPNGGKFMFDGQLHGAEDCGTETGYKFVKWVLESNSSEAVRIRNNNYLLAIPIINADTTSRQNMRRVNDNGTLVPYGVDLNRNFAQGWGVSWSGSSNPLDPYSYSGSEAASEPETKAVTYAMQKYKPEVYLNVHCGGQQKLRYTSSLSETTTRIMQGIEEISSRTKVSTMSLYNPSYMGSSGLVISEAAAQGASSWIFEISSWSNLPITLGEYHNRWYKEAFPVYEAMSNAVEKPP